MMQAYPPGENPFDDTSPYDLEAPQPGGKQPAAATVGGVLADPLFVVMGGKPMVHRVMAQERRQMLYNSVARLAVASVILGGLYTAVAAEINAFRVKPLDGHVAGKWGLIGLAATLVSYTAVRIYTVNKYNKEDDRNLTEVIATPVLTIPATMLLLATEKNWKSDGDGLAVSSAVVAHIALVAALGALAYFAKKAIETYRNRQPVLDMYADLREQYEVSL
ncbi:MAG: hypothetical protein P1U40_00110 [Coxiellaceae bacterium]|nr:hypothetical protein [Coxiellaceae bacterium]